MPVDIAIAPMGGAVGGLNLSQQNVLTHTIMETNNNTLDKAPFIIKINPVPPGVSIYGGKGKRGPSGPIVTTSDEDETPDSPRGNDKKPTSDATQTFSPPLLDHDYDNVSSPGNSSTASGPTYVRQPGFMHHAHEVSKPRIKKKKTASMIAMKEGLRRRDPTPPKSKPKRDPLPMRMRALPQSFWQQPNVAHNASPATAYPLLPPLCVRDDDIGEVRPITPPADDKDKEKPVKPHRPVERKLSLANTDLLFKLFEGVEKDVKKPVAPARDHTKRGKLRKVIPAPSTNKTLVSGEDPYMVDCVTEKLFPQLRLEQGKGSSSYSSQGSGMLLHVVTLKDGEKCISLPALSVEQNYSQMLSELVAHI